MSQCSTANSKLPATPGVPLFDPEQLLRDRDAAAALGVSRSQIWEWLRPGSDSYDPTFPKPVKLADRITRFVAGEIYAYRAKRIVLARGEVVQP